MVMSGLLRAAQMTAGHDEIRELDPDQVAALETHDST
jgi:hypothetical protein